MCSISLCMIVRNEENSIRRCLSSIIDMVDEIIIVDTGSQDKTIDICNEFGAKVYPYTWQEDFSAARNFSIKMATSDWILWMDADEELITTNKNGLKKLLEDNNEALFVKMIHFLNGEISEAKQDYISYHNRLFPNNKGYFFEGIIHERLTCDEKNITEKILTCEFLSINHYGYQKELVTDKAFRNLKLLLKERDLDTDNPWIDYHIG
ncbi:MAG: glycosyl transferase, partial [Anaerocolumna sp.]|nr:glycosyl transferase [Anaerocolumna sp.]